MGTRGLWGFVIDGEEKLTYNHFDSYPDGLGGNIIKFIQEADLNKVKEQAQNLLLVNEDEKPTDEQISHLVKYANQDVSTGALDEWYVLLRETQGEPQLTLEAGVMLDGHEFANDSLFCEWCYVIDLDNDILEIYQGFQDDPHNNGRFASENEKRGYYPIKLVDKYSLNNLPDSFPSYEDEEDGLDRG